MPSAKATDSQPHNQVLQQALVKLRFFRMSSPVQKAVSAAFKLFSRHNHKLITNDNLKDIISNFNQVTKMELQISPALLVDKPPSVDEAPVTYVRILENNLITVAMFILRQGKRLPLHDHPGMFGFIKVVHGSLTVKTYTPLDGSQHKVPHSVNEYLDNLYGSPRLPVLPCLYEGTRHVSETDDCCVLTPEGRNIHEIVSDSGTAAFIDILSPSYDHSYSETRRPCSYLKELEISSESNSASPISDIRYLVHIRAPNDYWCDEAAYTGPEVNSCISGI